MNKLSDEVGDFNIQKEMYAQKPEDGSYRISALELSVAGSSNTF